MTCWFFRHGILSRDNREDFFEPFQAATLPIQVVFDEGDRQHRQIQAKQAFVPAMDFPSEVR